VLSHLIQLGTVLSQHGNLSSVYSIKTINEITNTKALIYPNIRASNKIKKRNILKHTRLQYQDSVNLSIQSQWKQDGQFASPKSQV